MAKFPNIKLTQKGLNAIAKSSSENIVYTHVCLGDGVLADEDNILDFTDLKNKKLTADITDITNDSNSQITLQTVVSNKIVDEGFCAREIGVYAKQGDGEEFLYAYANASDNCDFMPSKEQPIDELKLKITLIVGNVDNVTAIINSSIIFITLADCQREIEKHNLNANAHGKIFAKKSDVYTKSETDNLLKNKADLKHGNHVPAVESANNSRFLRNDNTWQDVTANNIGAPTKTGAGASGTWNINISGNAKTATSATSATTAQVANSVKNDGANMSFHWSGQNGQPNWLWGGNNASDMYVYNPSNFTVNYAKSAGSAANSSNATNADKLDGKHLSEIYSYIGGRKQPTLTPILREIKTYNFSGTNWTDGASATKNITTSYDRNIPWYTNYGHIYLTQDFTNFDKVLFIFSDGGDHGMHALWESWLLLHAINWHYRFGLLGEEAQFYVLYGVQGNNHPHSNTKELFQQRANVNISEIYGVNY